MALPAPAAIHAGGATVTLAKDRVVGGSSLDGSLSVPTASHSDVTEPVAQDRTATVCLSSHPPVCDGSATLTVAAPRLVTLSFDHAVTMSGTPLQGQVALDGPAPAGGIEKSQTVTVERLRFSSASVSPASGVKPLSATAAFSLNGLAPANLDVGVMLQPTAPDGSSTTGDASLAAGQQSGSFPVVVDLTGARTTVLPPIEVRIVGTCLGDSLLGVVQLFVPPQ